MFDEIIDSIFSEFQPSNNEAEKNIRSSSGRVPVAELAPYLVRRNLNIY